MVRWYYLCNDYCLYSTVCDMNSFIHKTIDFSQDDRALYILLLKLDLMMRQAFHLWLHKVSALWDHVLSCMKVARPIVWQPTTQNWTYNLRSLSSYRDSAVHTQIHFTLRLCIASYCIASSWSYSTHSWRTRLTKWSCFQEGANQTWFGFLH